MSLKPRPWSYSSLNKFDLCPAQFHAVNVARIVKESSSEAIEYGNYVHKSFELRIRDGVELPSPLRHHESVMQKLVSIPGEKFCEHRIAINRKLEPTEFFANDVWSRGVLDYLCINAPLRIATIVDYKTGKRVPSRDQLDLCALYVFYTYPEIDRCYMDYYMTELPQELSGLYPYGMWYVRNREDIPAMWGKFTGTLKQYAEAFRANVWQERPSGLCAGWCPVTTCQHWKPARPRR